MTDPWSRLQQPNVLGSFVTGAQMNQRNQLLKQKQAEMAQAAQEREQMNSLQGRVLNDDKGAFNEYALRYPTQAKQYQEAVGMSIADQKQGIEQVGRLATHAYQLWKSGDQQQFQNFVNGVRNTLPPEVAQTIPDNVTPEWLLSTIAQTSDTWGQLNAVEMEQMKHHNAINLQGVKQEDRLQELASKNAFATEQKRLSADIDAAKPGDPEKLRKGYRDESKEFVKVRDSFNRVLASVEDPSPAGDLALIFNYMKMLDPGSVVREGEFANAENSGSIPQRLIAKYNAVLRGTRLSEKQREDFFDRSQRLYGKQRKSHKKTIDEWTRIAENSGVDPSLVIIDYGGDFDMPSDSAPTSLVPSQEDGVDFEYKMPTGGVK